MRSSIVAAAVGVFLVCCVTVSAFDGSSPPGAFFALSFDGINEYGATEYNQVGDSFTIEAWVRTTDSLSGSSFTDGAPLVYADVAGPARDFGVSIVDGKLAFGIGDGTVGGDRTVLSTSAVNTGQWLHVAAVRDAVTGFIRVYVNGLEEGSLDTGNTLTLDAPSSITLAGNMIDGRYLQAEIDELRIWDVARSEAEIRTFMCRQVAFTEPGLGCYVPFDYRRTGTGAFTSYSVIYDRSLPFNHIHGHNLEPEDWVWSGALVGADSVAAYPPGGSLAISHPDGDGFSLTGITGSPAGLQLVRVDGPPNVQNPPPGHSELDYRRHWGVYVVGGTAPTYDVVLSYAGHPDVAGEDLLALAVRDGNHDTSWADASATLDTTADTLSLSGQSGHHLYAWASRDPFSAILTGAGRALIFDGSDEYAEVDRLGVNTSFTLEAWIRSDVTGIGGATTGFYYGLPIFTGAGADTGRPDFGASIIGDRFMFGTCFGGALGTLKSILSISVVKNFEWVHVAAVRDQQTIRVYVNGVLEGSLDTGYDNPLDDADTIHIGGFPAHHRYFSGMMDEVRIWEVARTTNEIRTAMCRRLSGTEVGLVGYWRFDGTSGASAADSSPSGNHAALHNMEVEDRLWSGVRIGDWSVNAYPPAGSIAIDHPDGDGLTVSNVTGSPFGVHLYRVDGPPNLLLPPATYLAIDHARHWGVVLLGGASPTYDAVVSYAGHPGIVGEGLLGVASRGDNATAAWVDGGASLDTTADTLTLSGESGRHQYVLVSNGEVPAELLSFTVE